MFAKGGGSDINRRGLGCSIVLSANRPYCVPLYFLYFCFVFVTEFVGLFNPILERVNVSATHNSHKALLSLAFQTNSALLKELLGT